MSSRLDKPEFSREHRLGLVVYGGVALAIYMNGICQEFYNAVRGRGIYKLIKALTDADIVVDIISGTSAGGINGVLLSYALANSQGKNCIKFDKFADVWKNSGDINKLLFDPKEYSGLDISSFFNGVGYYKKEIKEALVARIKDLKENAPEDDWVSEIKELDLFITGTDTMGKINQVFDNTNRVIELKDHQAIFHLKYRDYADNPFNPDDITCEALAKLCQITSCFPVAFPSVTVKLEPLDKNDPDKKLIEWGDLTNRIVPENKPKLDNSLSLKQHNKKGKKLSDIEDDPGAGYRLHFVDGGVLDNRPFSYTIKEIYHREVDRRVSRKLFYVDPSPDRFKGNSEYENMLKPNIVRVVQDSLIAMPRYESINKDLELINEHNEKVRRYKFLLADLETLLDIEEKDQENNDFYDQQRNVYLRTRLISLENKILPLIFLKSEGLVKASQQEKNRTNKLEKAAKLLAEPFTTPQASSKRLKLLEQLEKDICHLDVDYTLRKYFFITEYVYRLLDENYLCEWLKSKKKQEIEQSSINDEILINLKLIINKLNKYRKLIETIKSNIDKLFISPEIEKYFLKLLDESNNSSEQFTEKFYRAMLWLHGQFLNTESLSKSENHEFSIKELNKDLTEKIHQIKSLSSLNKFFQLSGEEQLVELQDLAEKSLLKKLVDETKKKLLSSGSGEVEHYNYIKEKLLNYFNQFEKLDTVLYPLDYLAGIPEKQLIETFRISPEDAQLGLSSKFNDGERLEQKLAGDTLRAFGGFFKKSWRANDILWGRLDGLNRIVDALVTEEKIKNFPKLLEIEAEKEAKKKNQPIDRASYLDRLLEEALFSDFDRERSLKSEVDKQYLMDKKKELKEKLEKLFPSLYAPSSGEQPINKEYLQDFINSLVSVGHLVILDQDLIQTMEVSIEEQLDGKQQKVPTDKPDAPLPAEKSDESIAIPKFNRIDFSFDSAITALVVKQVAKKSLKSISLKEKEDFFNQHYKIGLETFYHIPESERIKLLLKGILIFQDIFLTWQRKTKAKINSNKSKPNPLDFWSRFGWTVVGWMINIAILVINFILWWRF
ncbi:patatin-related protein [Crinalium epipsammum PCC 9333]|uniref:Patatin-related protein n=1 Tax=Crinalium epipsammum PCC 9333 TaxID=1173022 RepID=K9W2F0_9CYAN|nr:patatin-like protein [Crinalium epipsammum]AFZ13937.1 patatin-related protein [Crinalium epipsammum PCC 9333]